MSTDTTKTIIHLSEAYPVNTIAMAVGLAVEQTQGQSNWTPNKQGPPGRSPAVGLGKGVEVGEVLESF